MSAIVRGRATRVLASEAGAALDADLRAATGTDDTDALQAVLDRARDGSPVHLVLDGPALVTGLDLSGQTTVEGSRGAGLVLARQSNRAMLRNVHRSRDAVVDRGITLRSLFLNGNREGQGAADGRRNIEPDGTFMAVLQFFGVEDLTIEDVQVWNPRAFGVWMGNVRRVTVRDLAIDSNFPRYPEGADPVAQRAYLDGFRSNLDGLHVNGPAANLLIERLRLRTEDDGLALNANDMGTDDMTISDVMGPYVGQGPISDVMVRDVEFDDGLQGIRLLSSDQRVDRVRIENVRGTVRHRMAVVSHFVSSGSLGDFGRITFRDIAVDPTPAATWDEIYPDWRQEPTPGAGRPGWEFGEEGDRALFALNSPIEHLALDGISVRTIDERPLIRVGADSRIQALRADLSVSGVAEAERILVVRPGAVIEDLHLTVHSDPLPAAPSEVSP